MNNKGQDPAIKPKFFASNMVSNSSRLSSFAAQLCGCRSSAKTPTTIAVRQLRLVVVAKDVHRAVQADLTGS